MEIRDVKRGSFLNHMINKRSCSSSSQGCSSSTINGTTSGGCQYSICNNGQCSACSCTCNSSLCTISTCVNPQCTVTNDGRCSISANTTFVNVYVLLLLVVHVIMNGKK